MEAVTFDDASKMTSEALFEGWNFASCHKVVDERAWQAEPRATTKLATEYPLTIAKYVANRGSAGAA